MGSHCICKRCPENHSFFELILCDNNLTTDQEYTNDGAVDLVMARTETVGDDEVTCTINFNLTGNSTSLSGQYSGTWIGAKLTTCRNGILGDISMTKN